MDLGAYIDISARWLADHTMIYDLAASAEKAMDHSYIVPIDPDWSDGPCLGSWNGQAALQAAVPLLVKTSLEAAKAAELAMGDGYSGNPTGKTAVRSVEKNSIRVSAVIARAGVITQFELWKQYSAATGYPFNRKKMSTWRFRDPEEEQTLKAVVDRRNELTHEPHPSNDPNMRELVEYTYTLHWLAKAAAMYA